MIEILFPASLFPLYQEGCHEVTGCVPLYQEVVRGYSPFVKGVRGLFPIVNNKDLNPYSKRAHLYVALDQGYIKKEQFDKLYEDIDKVQRKISNFIKYLNSTLK